MERIPPCSIVILWKATVQIQVTVWKMLRCGIFHRFPVSSLLRVTARSQALGDVIILLFLKMSKLSFWDGEASSGSVCMRVRINPEIIVHYSLSNLRAKEYIAQKNNTPCSLCQILSSETALLKSIKDFHKKVESDFFFLSVVSLGHWESSTSLWHCPMKENAFPHLPTAELTILTTWQHEWYNTWLPAETRLACQGFMLTLEPLWMNKMHLAPR